MLSSAVVFAQVPEPRWPDAEKCELSSNGGRLSVSAWCGTLEVPEDLNAPDGRRIELAWAVIEARTASPEPDPVVFLAGGPGQSARDAAPMIGRALDDINRNRDLVFVDQRGTGGSNSLDCRFDDQTFLTSPDMRQVNQRLRECQAEFDADVTQYTTIDAVEDLNRVRAHLGFDRINLIGGSYGTRVAQVYLRRYPDTVRATVIDGVVPMRLKLGSEHAGALDRAIERMLANCVADETCAARFPDIEQAFADLKARYRDKTMSIQVTDPRTGVAEEVDFSDETLAGSLRFLAYSAETQMMIPYLIHEAVTTGNPERLATQAIMTASQMSEEISIGLNFAVGCSEDWPYWPTDIDASGTLLGNSFTELYGMVCEWWPAEPVGPDYHQPFDVSSPVLILSGELDPVTPPRYGEEAAQQFSDSLHLVAPGRGHITLTNSCFGSIVTEFIAAANLADLDTECIDRLGPEPFFTSLLGPTP